MCEVVLGAIGWVMRLSVIASIFATVAASFAPALAKDFGFGELTENIANATKGTPAFIPFIERPTAEDAGLGGRAQAFGYLGSVANPQTAYPLGRDGSFYYRASTDDKCNPDSFTFPAGQKGPQKVVHQTMFRFEATADATYKGGTAGDKVFNLTAFNAKVLRRVRIMITDLKEYTLDFRTLRERVAQVSADPACANFKQALTKVYEGKVTITYYFGGEVSAGIKASIGDQINASLGLSAAASVGGSDADPNVLQFESEARVFAAKFRPVSEIVGRAPVQRARRTAANN